MYKFLIHTFSLHDMTNVGMIFQFLRSTTSTYTFASHPAPLRLRHPHRQTQTPTAVGLFNLGGVDRYCRKARPPPNDIRQKNAIFHWILDLKQRQPQSNLKPNQRQKTGFITATITAQPILSVAMPSLLRTLTFQDTLREQACLVYQLWYISSHHSYR